jgi:hypothetical protein
MNNRLRKKHGVVEVMKLLETHSDPDLRSLMWDMISNLRADLKNDGDLFFQFYIIHFKI